MKEFKSQENGKASKNHGQIGHGAELPQSSALLSFISQLHADALIERYEQMLADAENKQPDQHHRETRRSEADQQDTESA